MNSITIAGLAAFSLLAGACTEPFNQTEYGTQQTIGALTVAALGGLLGAQFGSGTGQLAATGAGVLIGGLIGSEIGRAMDQSDRLYANQAVVRAYDAPLGQTIYWNNPQSPYSGSIAPLRDGYTASGLYCREYQQTIRVAGRAETAVGTACRQADGTWRIVT